MLDQRVVAQAALGLGVLVVLCGCPGERAAPGAGRAAQGAGRAAGARALPMNSKLIDFQAPAIPPETEVVALTLAGNGVSTTYQVSLDLAE